MPAARLTLSALCTLAALAGPGTTLAAEAPLPPALDDRSFDVFIDDWEVGTHRFTFEGEPESFTLRSEASMRLKIAFVTMFRYEHEATERWEDGCLASVESTTEAKQDNAVTGRAEGDAFVVETALGADRYEDACTWGFAYWNPAMTTRATLVNPQDGQRFETTFEALEDGPLDIGDRTVRAKRTKLRGVPAGDVGLEDVKPVAITLYSDDDGRWIGLDAEVEGDRLLRYRPSADDPYRAR